MTLTTGALALLSTVIAVALAGYAARRGRQAAAAVAEADAARPIADADRARTALLGVVSHDLRTRADHLEAVTIRKHHVEQDQIRPRRRRGPHRPGLEAARGCPHRGGGSRGG